MIAIIDYKGGNIASLESALKRFSKKCIITSNRKEILSAKGVIFPGQGRAGSVMANLKAFGIDEIIPKIKAPFLGICIGMQLLMESSEEDAIKGFSVLKGKCYRFPEILKIPHLGWNQVQLTRKSPLTERVKTGSHFYFVHSYYVDLADDMVLGKTSYGFDFASMGQRENYFAVQFHPEKSGEPGLQLLNNFCNLC